MKSSIFQLCMLLGIIIQILGCSPSRRFDYRTAYKFKYIKHHPGKDTLPPEHLLARSPEIQDKNVSPAITPDKPIPAEEILPGKTIISMKTEIANSENKKPVASYENLSPKEKKEFRKKTKREVKEVKKEYRKIKKRRKGGIFRDIHPRLQGFIWVAIGLGIILVGAVVIPSGTFSVIVIILGFGLVAFGFLKVLGIIK